MFVSSQIRVNMGQDYSYSQPSSSEYDITSLLEEEAALYADEAAALYADEAESSYMIGEPAEYPPRAEPVTQLSRNNSTDLMAMEEMSDDLQTQLSQLKDQGIKSEQKLVKLEKTVVVCLLVCVLLLMGLVFIYLRGRASKGTYKLKSYAAI
nr:PREDICTED: uncharacterized protein LOC108832441 [Raphanus sativus]